MNSAAQRHERAHPTRGVYVSIAAILAVVTGVEVAIVFVELFEPVLIPLLLVLSAAKFSLVAMFYMHLRFDHRLFSALFVGGVVLATAVLVALLTLFRVILV